MGENTALSGMKAIQEFNRSIGLSVSESSIIDMVKAEGFPANKLGGIWESDKEEIKIWRRDRLVNGAQREREIIIYFNSSEERIRFAEEYCLSGRRISIDEIIKLINNKKKANKR